MNFPILETKRVLLRGLTPDDRFAVLSTYSGPDVAKLNITS
jgi:hypothetical protein